MSKKIKLPCSKCGVVDVEQEFSGDLDGVSCPKCGAWYGPAWFWDRGLFPCCGNPRKDNSIICDDCGIAYV